MKFGMRKPSIKKSIKARTTGKIKRNIKKAINPFYEKKGMGYINDPQKAIYNKVYNKTTFGASDLINNKQSNTTYYNSPNKYSKNIDRTCWTILAIIIPIIFIMLLLLCLICPYLIIIELLLIIIEKKLIKLIKKYN